MRVCEAAAPPSREQNPCVDGVTRGAVGYSRFPADIVSNGDIDLSKAFEHLNAPFIAPFVCLSEHTPLMPMARNMVPR